MALAAFLAMRSANVAGGSLPSTFGTAGRISRLTSCALRAEAGYHASPASGWRRLADWLPQSAESWLRMQAAYDLWKASKNRCPKIKPAPQSERAARRGQHDAKA